MTKLINLFLRNRKQILNYFNSVLLYEFTTNSSSVLPRNINMHFSKLFINQLYKMCDKKLKINKGKCEKTFKV